MALSRLGDYIELIDERNTDNSFDYTKLRGISINKVLIQTKATGTENLNLKNYKIVRKGQFTYCTVTSRNGNKISIAYNDDCDCIVSSINPVFKIKDENKLLPRYLMMFFNRAEFDRYARFNSWGSARETFMWEDLCDIVLDIPNINVQQKYVSIYEGLLESLCVYEKGLNDLKLVCDGYIERLRKDITPVEIGQFMIRSNKNSNNEYNYVLGVGQNGFIKPQKKPNESLKNYKIINKGDVCYAPPLYNILSDAIHVYTEDPVAVCSPIYEVFSCDERLNSEYLLLWLKRDEFKRYAEFYSLGVRNTFDYDLMKEVKIPIPSLEIQKQIVNIFHAYKDRKKFIESLKQKISNICPILIRGAIKEVKGGN